MKKLRFPTAACFVSSEESERSSIPSPLFLSLFTVAVILADYLLIQLLDVRPGAVDGAQSLVMSADKLIRHQ